MQAGMVMKIFACISSACLLLSVDITGGVFQFSHQPPTKLNCNPYDNTSLWRPILVCGGIIEENCYKLQWFHNSTDGNISVQPSNTILSCDYPTLEITELVNLTGDHWCEVVDLMTNETILRSNSLTIYEKENYNQMTPCHDVPIDNQNIVCITTTTTSPSVDILAVSSPIDNESTIFITTSPCINTLTTSSSSVSLLEMQSCDNDTTEWRNAFIAVSSFGVITILLLIISTVTFLFMWLRVRRKMKIGITQKPSTKYYKQSIIEIRNPQISIETTEETAPVEITSKASVHSNKIVDIVQENKQKGNKKDGGDEQEDSEYVEMSSFRESSFTSFKSLDVPTKIIDGNVYAIPNDRLLTVYEPLKRYD